ncbi:MAG: hypothetical protein PHR44_00855 [Candidatus Omnitrophica bacterium]|nr:hypothetical protein [Candidatus Omnitrophota bacterium]
MLFPTYNVGFRRGEEWTIVTGQIRNESSRNFALAVFKIVLFNKTYPIGSGIIKIRNFRSKTTKSFEQMIIGVGFNLIPSIEKYDIVLEGGS